MIMTTKLIEKDDPRYFSQTCNKPYDRHRYKIVCETKSIMVESWEEVQEYWWNNRNLLIPPVIEVLDKLKSNKGFK